MKVLTLSTIITTITIFLTTSSFLVSTVEAVPGLKGACRTRNYTVVDHLDLNRYLGKWYEISRSKSFYYDRDCYCVTADYSLLKKGRVSVNNTCRKKSQHAEPFSQVGRARQITPGKGDLRVTFLPFDVPFLNRFFEANYNIVALDEKDYQWVAILSCSRLPRVGGSNAWILSRSPKLNEETVNEIYKKLSQMGIDLSDQERTIQENCWDHEGDSQEKQQN